MNLPRRYVPNHNWSDYTEQEIAGAKMAIDLQPSPPKTPEKYDMAVAGALRLLRAIEKV